MPLDSRGLITTLKKKKKKLQGKLKSKSLLLKNVSTMTNINDFSTATTVCL